LVSTNGGQQPQWRGDGRELYYVQTDGYRRPQLACATEGGDEKIGDVSLSAELAAPRRDSRGPRLTSSDVDKSAQALARLRVGLGEPHRESDTAHRIDYRSLKADPSGG
jgi:hypothetical protein